MIAALAIFYLGIGFIYVGMLLALSDDDEVAGTWVVWGLLWPILSIIGLSYLITKKLSGR